MEDINIGLRLVRAPDDPAPNDAGFLEELAGINHAMHEAGVKFSQRAVAFDAVDAVGYPLAEYTLKYVVPSAITVVGTVIGIWIKAHYGRKARVTIGKDGIEIDANTAEEVERLLRQALKHKAAKDKQ